MAAEKKIKLMNYSAHETAVISEDSSLLEILNHTPRVLSGYLMLEGEHRLILMPGMSRICLCTIGNCIQRRKWPLTFNLPHRGDLMITCSTKDKDTVITITYKENVRVQHLKINIQLNEHTPTLPDWDQAVSTLKHLTADLERINNAIRETTAAA